MNNGAGTLEKHPLFVIPYQGKNREHILKSRKKGMKKMLLNNVKPPKAFAGRKVGTSFQIKDKTKMKHNHGIAYYNECPEEQCKTGRRISERIIDHAGRDSKSYFYKHFIESGHRSPDINDFKIIGSNFCKNVFKRKIVEA